MTATRILSRFKESAVVSVSAAALSVGSFGPAAADHAFDHFAFDNDHVDQGYIQPESSASFQLAQGSPNGNRPPREGACPIGIATLAGAALGGLVGAHIGSGIGMAVATGAGVFLGGAVGNRIDCP